MHLIQQFFAGLPFSEELKGRLLTFSGSSHQQFYQRLPLLLAPAFPGIDPARLEELTLSSYLYSRYTLYLDDLLDGDAVPTAPGQGDLLLAYGHLHEVAIRGLCNLFPASHPFWERFTQAQLAFAHAQRTERAAATRASAWTRLAYEQLAIGKAAVGEALVHALAGLSACPGNLPEVLTCLRHYHLALQYEDDIRDFGRDAQQGQRTLAYDEVLTYRAGQGYAAPSDPAKLQAYLFTSGVAEAHLRRAAALYGQISAVAARLELRELDRVVQGHAAQATESAALIHQQVLLATERAAAHSPTAP